MVMRWVMRRWSRGSAMLGLAALAAGCQSGGNDALKSADAPPPKPKITQSELIAFCPPVGLREGTAFFTSYEQAAAPRRARRAAPADAPPAEDPGDTAAPPKRIIYQTSITDVTRSCTHQDGTLTMTVGVAGKVVPGPAGKAGTLTLPVRIAVVKGDEVVYSQLHRQSVEVASPSTATQFLFTVSDISFPEPETRAIKGFVGFDEGPPKDAD